MLLQAYDFVHLAKHHGCKLQIGGSDQWGNITAGIDLGRRMLSQQLYGMTCPLLTTSDGRKMGKTEKGAVWLSPDKTSPYEFYQYFVNVADADVLMTIRFLSDIDHEEYRTLEAELATKPGAAQRRLAESLTRLVHGDSGLQSALAASKMLFGGEIESLSDNELNSIFSDVPSSSLPRTRLEEGANTDRRTLCCVARIEQRGKPEGLLRQVRSISTIAKSMGSIASCRESDLASESVIGLASREKEIRIAQV